MFASPAGYKTGCELQVSISGQTTFKQLKRNLRNFLEIKKMKLFNLSILLVLVFCVGTGLAGNPPEIQAKIQRCQAECKEICKRDQREGNTCLSKCSGEPIGCMPTRESSERMEHPQDKYSKSGIYTDENGQMFIVDVGQD